MNRIILTVLALALVLATAVSELCTRDQWESTQAATVYYNRQQGGTITEISRTYFDAKNRRKAIFATMVDGPFESKYQVVLRFEKGDKDGRVYIVDLGKGTCWTQTVPGPYQAQCLPPNALHDSDFTMGPPGNGLRVSGYNIKVKGVDVYVAIAKDGEYFLPIFERASGFVPELGSNMLQTMAVYDVAMGVSNTTVFNIPAKCKEEHDMSAAKFLMRGIGVMAV